MQGLATYPGIEQLRSASYTLAHGITPGVATLELVPQAGLPDLTGTLTFAYGGSVLAFADCRVDSLGLQRDARGYVWRLALLDRRWKWAFGAISGCYNLRRDNGALDPECAKTPRELAALCLDAMGETGYDTSALPNDARPAVDWDHANPARALADLADALGARLVLTLGGTVRLALAGQGAGLPTGSDVQAASLVLDPPARPDTVAIVCGRTLYQHDFRLEAVGLDRDDSIRPIDELSYTPESGWESADVPAFNQVPDPRDRRRAAATVFRWYRIRAAGLNLAEFGTVDHVEQILPLDDLQAEVVDGTSAPRRRPAWVFGVWHDASHDYDFDNTVSALQPIRDETSADARRAMYNRPFVVDRPRGIVRFDEPLYQLRAVSEGYALAPAEIVLRTACHVQHAGTRAWKRHERQRSTGGTPQGTPTDFLPHDELRRTIVPVFNDDYALDDVVDNLAQVDAECDRLLDLALSRYAATQPAAITYVGLKAIDPDGAIEHVSWHVGLGGCTTRACRQCDLAVGTIGYRERRAQERLRDLAAQPPATALRTHDLLAQRRVSR